MVWIPPGWDHEVITLEGGVHKEDDDIVYVHWMTWYLLWNLCNQAMRDFFTGKTPEQNTNKNLRPRQKEEVYMVVTNYGNRIERNREYRSGWQLLGIGRNKEGAENYREEHTENKISASYCFC